MEHKGTVYFFTGLSGAGKTTVGSLFYQRLKNTKPNAVYLDGDEIRVAFGEDVGYTNDERLRWAGDVYKRQVSRMVYSSVSAAAGKGSENGFRRSRPAAAGVPGRCPGAHRLSRP